MTSLSGLVFCGCTGECCVYLHLCLGSCSIQLRPCGYSHFNLLIHSVSNSLGLCSMLWALSSASGVMTCSSVMPMLCMPWHLERCQF